MKKIQWNENYFESIQTERQAYFLGLLMTDGCIHSTKYTNYMSLELQERDEHILHTFREELQAKVSLRRTKNKSVRLTIGNNKLISDLANLGVIPKKTFITAAPKIQEKLQRHFWRGAIDGDGTISFPNNKRSSFAFCGSEILVSDFKKFCGNITDKDYKIYPHRNIYYYRVSGENCFKVLKVLYGESEVFLTRKKIIYDEMEEFFLKRTRSSVFTGVSYNKEKRKFESYCSFNKKTKKLGYFEKEIEAALAYDHFVYEHRLNRRINFPERLGS